jgi:hypothetical protein
VGKHDVRGSLHRRRAGGARCASAWRFDLKAVAPDGPRWLTLVLGLVALISFGLGAGGGQRGCPVPGVDRIGHGCGRDRHRCDSGARSSVADVGGACGGCDSRSRLDSLRDREHAGFRPLNAEEVVRMKRLREWSKKVSLRRARGRFRTVGWVVGSGVEHRRTRLVGGSAVSSPVCSVRPVR